MAYGWLGEKVRLVPLDRERHLDNAVLWINDPDVTRWTDIGDWPMTRGGEEAFFAAADASPTDSANFAIETLDGEHIGFSGILGIDRHHRVARTGSFIGRPELWGQGLGRDAALVRSRYAFEVLGLRVVKAEVMAGNERSLRMLASVGYREVGRIPGWYFNRGTYYDAVVMVLSAG